MKRNKTPDYRGHHVFGVPPLIHVQRTGQPLPQSIQQAMRYLRSQCLDQVSPPQRAYVERVLGGEEGPRLTALPFLLGLATHQKPFLSLQGSARLMPKFLSFLYGWSLLPALGTASFCPGVCTLPSLRDCLSLRPSVHPRLHDSHLSLWQQAVNHLPSGLAEPIRKSGRLPVSKVAYALDTPVLGSQFPFSSFPQWIRWASFASLGSSPGFRAYAK